MTATYAPIVSLVNSGVGLIRETIATIKADTYESRYQHGFLVAGGLGKVAMTLPLYLSNGATTPTFMDPAIAGGAMAVIGYGVYFYFNNKTSKTPIISLPPSNPTPLQAVVISRNYTQAAHTIANTSPGSTSTTPLLIRSKV